MLARGVPRARVYEEIMKEGQEPPPPERKEVPPATSKDPAKGGANATVSLKHGTEQKTDSSAGDGPVHAACQAIEKIVGVPGKLETFQMKAASAGKDALGEAHLIVQFDGRPFTGTGVSTDIVEAAVLAYLNAMNKFLALKQG